MHVDEGRNSKFFENLDVRLTFLPRLIFRRTNKIKLYRMLSVLFWFIRQFFMPNPFEVLGDGITVIIDEVPILLTPDVLNWIAGLGLPAFTFLVVGLYYESRSAPAAGSLLYMIFFCVHTGILYLMSLAYPAIWLIVVIAVVYIGIHTVVVIVGRRTDFL